MPFGFGGGGGNGNGNDNGDAPVVVQGIAVPQQGGGYVQQQQQPVYAAPPQNPSYAPQQQQQQPQQQAYAQPVQVNAMTMPFGASNNKYSAAPDGGDFNGYKGEPQPQQYNDVAFAVVFILHLLVMLVLGVMYGGNVVQGGGGNGGYGGVVFCVASCGLFAMGLSSLALGFMMKFPSQLIKMGLFFSIGMSLMFGMLGLLAGQIMMAGMGFLSFAVGICYAYFVWDRIPFAAATMNTALSSVRDNMGLAVVAYFFLALAFGWSIAWAVSATGTMAALGQSALFLFLVSYYWTHQVIQNTVHVTAAGVIGTWWFQPSEASSCCSKALKDSFLRATTYSFGSICFGSLLVAIVQALRQMLHIARDNDECQILVCIIDCILGCIEAIIEELNKWAYVYVGLYGYSYLEAGKNVMTLFQNKGWSSIISENLVENVLLMVSVGIGLVTGLVGWILASMDQNMFAALGAENPGLIGFILGFLVGLVLASILMSVVSSATNTVIVCFAESPNEFQQNHPQLSNEMRAAWRQAWPAECGNY